MTKIAIIGSGAAGIEAAKILGSRNYEIHLFEKENDIAENIRNKAYLFPNFSKSEELVHYFESVVEQSSITLHKNCEICFIKQQENKWLLTDQNNEERAFDAVLLATGYTPFQAEKKEELGYGIYKGIITSLDLERMIINNKVVNSTGGTPKRVVFLQCVGSRDEKSGNNYCSKVCCVTAVKQSIELRKMLPNAELFIFYMDLRMWGQHFEEMYRKSQEEYNVKYVRGRISEAAATFDGKVQIKSEDTLIGTPLKLTTDLLVLMVGMEASRGTKNLATQCNIAGDYGFAQSINPFIQDNITTHKGLFIAGTCKRPMSINDTINDARSAANEIINYLQ